MAEESHVFAWSWTRSAIAFAGGGFFVFLAVAPLTYWFSLGVTPAGWIGLVLYEALFIGLGLWLLLVRSSLEIRPGDRRVIKEWRVLGLPVVRHDWEFAEFQSVAITFSGAVTHTFAGNIKSRTASVMLRRRNERGSVEVLNFLMAPFHDEIPEHARAAAAEVARLIEIPITPSAG